MNLFQQGGPLMWPLLALSVATLAVMARTFVVFNHHAFPGPRQPLHSGDAAPGQHAGFARPGAGQRALFRRILRRAGFCRARRAKREAHAQLAGEEALFSLSRRLDFLSTAGLGGSAHRPAGHGRGMISAFSKLASSGNVDITMLAGGICRPC